MKATREASLGMMPEDDERAVRVHLGALHEAGHVIVACHFGLPITAIQVDDGPHPAGRVNVDVDERHPTPELTCRMQITFAGGDAARSFVVGDALPTGDDRIEIVNRGVPDGYTTEGYLREVSDAALEVLRKHGRELAALAWELDKAEMTPAEALALVTSPHRVTEALIERDALDGVPPRSSRSADVRHLVWRSLLPDRGGG